MPNEEEAKQAKKKIPSALKRHRQSLKRQMVNKMRKSRVKNIEAKLNALIKEGNKERVQAFAGTVIARDGGGSTETFTVRRISFGVGIEKVFPVHSPYIEKIEIERSSRVRRAKLYYLRERTGKAARLREI